MHELSVKQECALDRICGRPAADEIRVVGWLAGGPVLEWSGGRWLLEPDGTLERLTKRRDR